MDNKLLQHVIAQYVPEQYLASFAKHDTDVKAQAGQVRLHGVIMPDGFEVYSGVVTPKSFRAEFDEAVADADGAVEISINSPGGSTTAGGEIYTMLITSDATVNTVIAGAAYSYASVIALAGNHRSISPVGQVLIHEPYGGAVGTAKEVRGFAKMLDKTAQTMAAVYDKHFDFSNSEHASAMTAMRSNGGFGATFTPQELLEMGYVHEIISDGEDDDAGDAQMNADLQVWADALKDLDARLGDGVQ